LSISTFYELKPVAEFLLVDSAMFYFLHYPVTKPTELLASSKATLNEDCLKTIAKDMPRNEGLLK
jgi:hypothetical protein